jgi:hypothetical protein
MAKDGMMCREWSVLLRAAEARWSDFLDILTARSPEDGRVRALIDATPRAGSP